MHVYPVKHEIHAVNPQYAVDARAKLFNSAEQFGTLAQVAVRSVTGAATLISGEQVWHAEQEKVYGHLLRAPSLRCRRSVGHAAPMQTE